MKIGILTLPLHTNYGGILQAFALQTTLQRLGHEAIVVGKDRSLEEDFFHEAFAFFSYLRNGCKGGYSMNRTKNRERGMRELHTNIFIKKHIKIVQVKDIVRDFPNSFDAIVVGSDQVWRKRTFCGMCDCGVENAFLQFAEHWNIKRLAYAASFGTDTWEYSDEETMECARLLSHFDAVSVREDIGVELCARYLRRNDVVHVIDPTLLLMKEDYEHLVRDANVPNSEGNLMVYFLDESREKKDLVSKIARDRKLIPFTTNQSDDVFSRDNNAIQPPIEKWLRGFMDADFIVTDSFHACVFSIIFNKPFIAIGNEKRGLSRFFSLLSLFGLNDNLVISSDEYNAIRSYAIPRKSEDLILLKREQSLSFLRNNLTL